MPNIHYDSDILLVFLLFLILAMLTACIILHCKYACLYSNISAEVMWALGEFHYSNKYRKSTNLGCPPQDPDSGKTTNHIDS